MKTYTSSQCARLMDNYVSLYGGHCTVIEEGCLGWGKVLLHSANGHKNVIIQEVFLNEWSSAHTIRMYNEVPKKYKKFIDQ